MGGEAATSKGTSEIRYQDLLANSIPGAAPETQDRLVTNPTLSVLILCTHLFKHFSRTPNQGTPLIKLAELADIRDLVRHPKFDQRLFLELVSRFGGQDALRFVAHLLRTYFGHQPLPLPPELSRRDRADGGFPFPRRLWYMGWADTSTASSSIWITNCSAPPRRSPRGVRGDEEPRPVRRFPGFSRGGL